MATYYKMKHKFSNEHSSYMSRVEYKHNAV